MKKLLCALFVSLSVNILPQSFDIVRITNLPGYDCSNPVSLEPSNSQGIFAFEANDGNKTSIMLGKYNPDTYKITILQNLTNNNFRNINPQIRYYGYGSYKLIYQTNEKGNWDIAYRIFTDTSVSEPVFLADSPYDETNPHLFVYKWGMDKDWFTYTVKYSNSTAAYMQETDSGSVPLEYFHPGTGSHYSSPVMFPYGHEFNTYAMYAALLDSSDSHRYIVYQPYKSAYWKDKIIIPADSVSNLAVNAFDYHWNLTYAAKNKNTGRSGIYSLGLADTTVTELFPSRPYDITELASNVSYVFGKRQGSSVVFDRMYGFKAERNDSVFIGMPQYFVIPDTAYGNYVDTLVYTKAKGTNVRECRFGNHYLGEVFFTIWQDSADGHLQLFGHLVYNPIGAVADENTPASFTLGQNYPNPFNPSTKISYHLINGGTVKLTIFNSLGQSVSVPVNEYQSAGAHEINFTARGLSSGVYFYQLKSGSYTETKKMLLMK